MKISFFVRNLDSNPIVRAWPLAQAAKQLGYEVEILGYIKKGSQVYAPYRDKTDYKLLHIEKFREVFFKARKLSRLASGDIIYCCKPSLDTILPSIFATSFGRSKRLILDVEDNELWTPQIPIAGKGFARLKWYWTIRWNLFAHLLLKFCRYRATVSSTGLKKRYGGEIILHGPDGDVFDPELPELQSEVAKKTYRIGADKISILFAGMPQRHKGLDLIVEAVTRLKQYRLVLAGNPEWEEFAVAKSQLENRCHCVGMIPNDEMPLLLAAVDLIVVPQRLNDFTRFQMPAKLLEAMAMAKGVVVSDVSDLSDIVAANTDSQCGWVCEHDNLESLVQCLVEIAENPILLAKRGARARRYFLENASQSKINTKIENLLDSLAQ